MSKFVPKTNRVSNWVTVVLIIMLLLVPLTYTLIDLLLVNANQSIEGNTWFIMIALSLSLIGVWGAFFWQIYVFKNIQYTENGITMPTLKGIRTLQWSEITNIEYDVYLRCFIYTEKMKWSIPLTLYKNHIELLEYMINQVKKHRNIE